MMSMVTCQMSSKDMFHAGSGQGPGMSMSGGMPAGGLTNQTGAGKNAHNPSSSTCHMSVFLSCYWTKADLGGAMCLRSSLLPISETFCCLETCAVCRAHEPQRHAAAAEQEPAAAALNWTCNASSSWGTALWNVGATPVRRN